MIYHIIESRAPPGATNEPASGARLRSRRPAGMAGTLGLDARELRPHLSIVYALVAYGILRVVFAHVVGTGGFATPSSLDKGPAAFAPMMLVGANHGPRGRAAGRHIPERSPAVLH
jgi:hypothetical protein